MSALAKTSQFEGEYATAYGVDVLLAMQGGKVVAVGVDSIRDGLPIPPDDPLFTYLGTNQFVGSVSVRGGHGSFYLVGFHKFIMFCMMNPSPKLEAFREDLARIAERVQNHGSYIDPKAGPSAFIPAGFENNKNMQMLAMLMDHEVRFDQLSQRVVRSEQQIEQVQQQLGQGPKGWTLASWLKRHGVNADLELLKAEGAKISRVCKQRGILRLQDEKGRPLQVCMGSDYPSNVWPIEALKIWWPDFCRRYERPVHWEV